MPVPSWAMRIFIVLASRRRSNAPGALSMLTISEVRSATLERSIGEEGDYLGELVGVGEAAHHVKLLDQDRDRSRPERPPPTTTKVPSASRQPRRSGCRARCAGALEDHVDLQALDVSRLNHRIECAVYPRRLRRSCGARWTARSARRAPPVVPREPAAKLPDRTATHDEHRPAAEFPAARTARSATAAGSTNQTRHDPSRPATRQGLR